MNPKLTVSVDTNMDPNDQNILLFSSIEQATIVIKTNLLTK